MIDIALNVTFTLMSMISHLASIGLILDMIGVSILFFVVISAGEQVVRIDKEEERLRLKKKNKKETALIIGYTFIVIGFLFQLIANESKV